MAGLTDMEDLLGRVSNPETMHYLREAYVCYGASAYRGCIVLTTNALFDDLRHKTKALAPINNEAKNISIEIERLVSEQKPFETILVDRLTAKNILSKTQGDRLKQIITHRNKAAHPSGVYASAEEARWVFFESVDKFLSQPVLGANQLADQILSKLSDQLFFPDSNITNITAIVDEEVSSVHPLAYDYLVTKIVERLGSTDVLKNARIFLSGCANLKNEALNSSLISRFIRVKASNSGFVLDLMAVVSVEPKLFELADDTTRMRLAKSFADAANAQLDISITALNHPTKLLANMAKSLDQTKLVKELKEMINNIGEKYYSNSAISTPLASAGIIRDHIITIILDKAKSPNFDIANKFARGFSDMDEALARVLTDDESLKLILAVINASGHGAFSARDVSRLKFKSMPYIKEKALRFLQKKSKTSREILREFSFDESASEFIDAYF